jgi:hypothetical protein
MKLGIFKLSALAGFLCISMTSHASHFITEVENFTNSDNCNVRTIAGSGPQTVYEVTCPEDTIHVSIYQYTYSGCNIWTDTSGYRVQNYDASNCSHYRIYPD